MIRLALAVLLVLATTLPAAAHPGLAPSHDFLTGFLHPLSGLDHVMAMLALGFWAGALGGRALWQWPLAFLLSLLLDAMIAQSLGYHSSAEWLVLGSALVFAGLAVFRFRLPSGVALPLIIAAAFAHGHVHGSELGLGPSDLGATLGFLAATAALHLLGVLLAYLTSRTEVRAFRATS
jgi:urease accessory protein